MNKHKICFVSDSHLAFDDRIYWKEAVSLLKEGYEISHICLGKKNDEFISDEGIKIVQIQRKQYFNNPYINKLYKVLTLKNEYGKIYRAARCIKAEIFHFHDLKLLKIARKIKKLPWRPKLIHCIRESYPDMIRDYNPTKGISTLIKNIYASYIELWEIEMVKKADHIITIDDAMYTKFKAIVGNEKISLIYNFSNIFPEKPDTIKEYDLIYTGGISEPRGILQIIQAVEIIKTKYNNFKFLLIGIVHQSDFRSKLEEYIIKHDLTENIEIKNWVPHPEINNYLSKSKIGIINFLPIPKFYKNISIKQFEYMAFGLPVIGSHLPPIKDFIEPVNAGIIVDPANVEEIVNAVLKLLSDHNLYNELSKNAAKAANEKYNWKSEEIKLIGIYKKLLSVN